MEKKQVQELIERTVKTLSGETTCWQDKRLYEFIEISKKQQKEIDRLTDVIQYVNILASEFYSQSDDNGILYIPDNIKPNKSILQEIFVISDETIQNSEVVIDKDELLK